jgi:hypothetical protein
VFKKFYLTVNDVPVCKVETSGEIRYFVMDDKYPFLTNPVEIMPGNAGEVTESEFMKYANPSAVGLLKKLLK